MTPLVIRRTSGNEDLSGCFTIERGTERISGLNWGEMIEVITAATRADRPLPYRSNEVSGVTITLSREDAEQIQQGLSDIACWVRGFEAAIPEDFGRHPMGAEAVRNINIKLKSAINAFDERQK